MLRNTYDTPLKIAAYLGAVNRSNMLKKQGVNALIGSFLIAINKIFLTLIPPIFLCLKNVLWFLLLLHIY